MVAMAHCADLVHRAASNGWPGVLVPHRGNTARHGAHLQGPALSAHTGRTDIIFQLVIAGRALHTGCVT